MVKIWLLQKVGKNQTKVAVVEEIGGNDIVLSIEQNWPRTKTCKKTFLVGWVDGWLDGSKSCSKDCLQQSKFKL